MAVDPFVSLASSLHAGPRTFALLLGSGVSVSAGVPSGWNLTLDLVRRLAIAQGDDAGDDPVSWYRAHADGDPDYSGLLTELAPSPADRRNLLERYFEPTEEERAEGSKVPTKAHRAIAYLVAQGFVKVIGDNELRSASRDRSRRGKRSGTDRFKPGARSRRDAHRTQPVHDHQSPWRLPLA